MYNKSENNILSGDVIHACIEVHKSLGPGLLESVYKECLAHELSINSIPFEREVSIPVHYKDCVVQTTLKADFIIDNALILEVKAVKDMIPLYQAQILTYLRLTNIKVGLLINFNVAVLTESIKRFSLYDKTDLGT